MDGAVERSANPSAGKDLREGAGQSAPLSAKENFDSGPHHTPGPWRLNMHPPSDWNPSEYPDAIVGPDGRHIVATCITLSMSRDGEPLANARLIAAAPEMLAALRELVTAADTHIELVDQVERARAAIAKAVARSGRAA